MRSDLDVLCLKGENIHFYAAAEAVFGVFKVSENYIPAPACMFIITVQLQYQVMTCIYKWAIAEMEKNPPVILLHTLLQCF